MFNKVNIQLLTIVSIHYTHYKYDTYRLYLVPRAMYSTGNKVPCLNKYIVACIQMGYLIMMTYMYI